VADKLVQVNGAYNKRLRDMGDGTFAEVVAVGGNAIVESEGTGDEAIAVSSEVASVPQRLLAVRCHLSAAPTTPGSLTITLNDATAAAYDTLLYSASMVGVTDLLWQPDGELVLNVGDTVHVAYANEDEVVFGVTITAEVL
jgi:hypothetical protein